MKCRIENGEVIPQCIGTAAALGCGKSNEAVLSFCTCDIAPTNEQANNLRISKLIDRVVRLEKEVAELKSAAQKKDEGLIVK